MKKYIIDILNGILIVVGACALADVFDDNFNKVFLEVVAGLGTAYLIISILLFIICPVKFDWHLVRGNYILKVLAFVLYTPFVMTGAYCLWGAEENPMALVYEENLYKEVKQDGICPAASSSLPDEIRNKQEDPSLFWSVYYHYIDPGNQHMTTTPNGRLWAAIIGILGVFLVNGLLVSAIIGWIDIRKEKWQKGEVKYPILLWLRKHYVIIGGNDMVAGIARQLFESKEYQKILFKPYILIQTNRDVEAFRRELFTGLTEKQQKKIIIYYGSRTSDDDIAALMLEKAKEVYILGEDTRTDDIESYHDTMNMECLRLAYLYLSNKEPYIARVNELKALESQIGTLEKQCKEDIDVNLKNIYKKSLEKAKTTLKNKLKEIVICRVMFEFQTTFSVYQFSEISSDIHNYINFKPFNYYEMWAQRVFICKEFKKNLNEFKSYIPLEGVGITRDSDNFVHLIIVGMSRMGVALAIEAAHLAHYPNFETKKKRTRITFIDEKMENEMNFFKGRFQSMFSVARHRYVSEMVGSIYNDVKKYPWVNPLKYSMSNSAYYGDYLGDDFIDIEWEFINGSIEHPTVQQYLLEASNNTDAKLTIAVCLPEDNKALAAALYLPRTIYLKDNVQQILVYQRFASSTINIVSNKRFSSPYNNKLKSFGMASEGYDVSLVNDAEIIAELVSNRYHNLHSDIDKYTDILIKNNIDHDAFNLANDIKLRLLNKFALDINYMLKNDIKVQAIVDNSEKYCKENGVSKIDKVSVAMWWSDIYNANLLWTKLRCIDFIDDGTINELSDYDIWDLANVEHNRWNMEQLLMTYRPLTEEEMFDVLYYAVKPIRKIYKGEMKHGDICSCTQLKVYNDTFKYDVAFARDLIDIYYKVKAMNESK